MDDVLQELVDLHQELTTKQAGEFSKYYDIYRFCRQNIRRFPLSALPRDKFRNEHILLQIKDQKQVKNKAQDELTGFIPENGVILIVNDYVGFDIISEPSIWEGYNMEENTCLINMSQDLLLCWKKYGLMNTIISFAQNGIPEKFNKNELTELVTNLCKKFGFNCVYYLLKLIHGRRYTAGYWIIEGIVKSLPEQSLEPSSKRLKLTGALESNPMSFHLSN